MAISFLIKAVITAVVSIAVGYALTKIFKPNPSEQNLKSPGSRHRQPPNTDNKLPVFYGKNRNKGTTVSVAISSNRKTMAFIIAVGHGAIDSVDTVQWGDYTLYFDGDYNTGLRSVTNAKDLYGVSDGFLNNGRMKFRMYKNGGRCTEMESFNGIGNRWSSTDTMTNTPFMYVELYYNAEKGVTRLGNLSIDFKGRKTQTIIQTQQNDIQTYPSGFSYSVSGTKTYSTNPARCFLDYSMDEKDGGGLPEIEMDLESLYELQQFCDKDIYTYVAYADGNTIPSELLSRVPPQPVPTFSRTPTLSGERTTNQYIGTLIKQDPITDAAILNNPDSYTWRPYSSNVSIEPTRKLFTCNGSVDTNNNVGSNMVDMLVCCQATPTFELGKLGVVVNQKKDVIYPRDASRPEDAYQYTHLNQIARFTTIDHRFNEDNIFGGVDISFSAAQDTLNEITMDFNNIKFKFNPDQVTIKIPDSVKNTNEYISSETVSLRFTNNNIEAIILGTVILNQSRQDVIVKFTTDLRGLTLRSGDIFELSQEAFGMKDKKFRVNRLDEVEVGGAHGIEVTGIEYVDAIYNVAYLNETDVATNTILTNTVPQVYSLISDPSINPPNLTITFEVINNQHSSYYEVKHKLASALDSVYTITNVPNTSTSYRDIGGGARVDIIVHVITGLTADRSYTVEITVLYDDGTGNIIRGAIHTGDFRTNSPPI